MNHAVLGIVLGLAAGTIASGMMIPMAFPDKRAAIAAAFVSRFAIGFLTANTALPINPVRAGAGIGLVVSTPDALITKAYAPILGIGTLLGGLCGGVVWLWG